MLHAGLILALFGARYPVFAKGWDVFYDVGVDVFFILVAVCLSNFSKKKLAYKPFPGTVNLLSIGSFVLVAIFINKIIAVPLLHLVSEGAPELLSKKLMPSALQKESPPKALFELLRSYWDIVAYGPIVEEITFRALLIGAFLRKRLNLWYLILTSMFAFVYVHNPIWNLWDLPIYEHIFMLERFLIITCTITYVFLKFGLIASIYVHFLINLMLQLVSDGLELLVAGIMLITVLTATYKLKEILFDKFRQAA